MRLITKLMITIMNYQILGFLVDEFNNHYQNQIINMREYLLREIIVLLEKYALENNIDLIFDSTSYLIASNALDITNNINSELTKLKINLEFKDFEKIKFIEIKQILEKNSWKLNQKFPIMRFSLVLNL